MAVGKRLARREEDLAPGAVDRHDAARDQLDGLVVEEFLRPEHQAVRPGRALDIALGQGRPLIGQMRLVIDQADAL